MTGSGQERRSERVIGAVALSLVLLGCLLVLWPFLTAVLWGIVLVFTTWRPYERLLRSMGGRRTLAALVMTLGIATVVLLPFVIVGITIADDVRSLTVAARHAFEGGPPDPPSWLGRIPLVGQKAVDSWVALAGDSQRLMSLLKGLVEPTTSVLLGAGLLLGKGIFELTLSVLVAFFLYRDGVYVAERAVAGAHRIAGDRGTHLLELAGATIRSVVYGILGTALVQGVLAGIGFLIARVPGAVALAFLTFFLSILPFGPPLIWGPVAIWLFYKGMVGWGIFMVIWGLIISSADNVVKPWLISQGANMPFVLILFGVLGGAMAFGFVGVFLGPTLLAVGYRLVLEWVAVKRTTAVESMAAEQP